MRNENLIELVRRLQSKDEEAFNEIYRRYHKLVRYIAFSLTKNTADTDEVTQEVFLQVQSSIKSLNNPEMLKAWISKITYSKAKMLFRKRKDYYMDEVYLDILQNKEEMHLDFLPDKKSRNYQDKKILYECIARLKPNFQEVLILHYFLELNIKEIAEMTKNPMGTVKSRLLFAKKYLRTEIEAYMNLSNEPLTFRSSTLEALLCSMALYPYRNPNVLYRLRYARISLPFMVFAIIGGIFTGVGFFTVYPFWHANRNVSNQAYTVSNEVRNLNNNKQFPTIMYQNVEITNARDAYKLLIDWADCEVEMQMKSKEEVQEIEPIYIALMEFGEGYADLLKQINWNIEFEKMR